MKVALLLSVVSLIGAVGALPAQPVRLSDVALTGEGLPCDREPCDQFGVAVASDLDLDHDGTPDVVVAAFGAQRIYVFSGPVDSDRRASRADVVMTGLDVNFAPLNDGPDHDVNGDGIDDLIFAARNGGDGATVLGGQIWIFHGPVTADGTVAAGVLGDADATIVGTNFFEVGRSVSVADLDGDGIGDLITGAPQNDAGKVLIYPGPIGGALTMSDAATTIDGVIPGEAFGDALTVGDWNADAVPDLAVGSEAFPLTTSSGRVYVFFGPIPSGQLSASSADLVIDGDPSNDQFGSHLANAGDVDGDGVDDLLVGADEVFGPGPGNAYLFLGPLGPGVDSSASADASFRGEEGFDRFAFVSAAGDVNGDGFGDVVIGAPDAAASDGRAHLFFGPLSGDFAWSDADLLFTGPSGSPVDRLGTAFYSAGDLDGNGFDDLVIGALGFEEAGFARIFYAPGLDLGVTTRGSTQVPAAGGRIRFRMDLVNTATASRSENLWFSVARPDGGSEVGGPFTRVLEPGAVGRLAVQLSLSAQDPAGEYVVTASAGRFPDALVSESFTFTKRP